MKPKRLVKALLCLLLAPALVYAGRVLALYILARAFGELNLNAETYNIAPKWMRFLADETDKIAYIAGFMTGICALLPAKTPGGDAKGSDALKALGAGIIACAAGFGAIMLLRFFDEIRFLKYIRRGNAADYMYWLTLSAFAALWLRALPGEVKGVPKLALMAVSAVFEMLLIMYLNGEFSLMLAVNALLFGVAAFMLYERRRTTVYEIALFFGYTAGHYIVSGYPNGGGFSVSPDVFTGGNMGLWQSVITSTPLICIIARETIKVRKETSDEKEAFVHSKPLRGSKKGA